MVGIGGNEHKRAGADRLVPGLRPADALSLQDIDHFFLIWMAMQSMFSPGGLLSDIDLQVPGPNVFRAKQVFRPTPVHPDKPPFIFSNHHTTHGIISFLAIHVSG